MDSAAMSDLIAEASLLGDFNGDALSRKVSSLVGALRDGETEDMKDWDGFTLSVSLIALGVSILKGANVPSSAVAELGRILYGMAETPRKGD